MEPGKYDRQASSKEIGYFTPSHFHEGMKTKILHSLCETLPIILVVLILFFIKNGLPETPSQWMGMIGGTAVATAIFLLVDLLLMEKSKNFINR